MASISEVIGLILFFIGRIIKMKSFQRTGIVLVDIYCVWVFFHWQENNKWVRLFAVFWVIVSTLKFVFR